MVKNQSFKNIRHTDFKEVNDMEPKKYHANQVLHIIRHNMRALFGVVFGSIAASASEGSRAPPAEAGGRNSKKISLSIIFDILILRR